MAFALAPEAIAAGYRLSVHETIGSTSTEAMARARDGDAGPLWVVAREQSAGKGRRGSAWQTPLGNLAASLVLTTDLPAVRIATLGFVAGLALDAALASVSAGEAAAQTALDEASGGRDRFALKWPNDVVAEGGKLAGILLASEDVAPGRRAVAIGIGVNVAVSPAGLAYPATSLATLGCAASAEDLFQALSAAWVGAYATWAGEGGFVSIRKAWLARAAGLGRPVAVRTGGAVTRGVFETIDEHGQLVIRVADGSALTVSAGEVHFGVAASAPSEMRA